MSRFPAWRAVVLLGLALVIVPGQEEAPTPYFSLSSGRTFAPGETPTVELSAQRVEFLDFRVYRVNDPVKFFQRLENPHSLGQRSEARPETAPTFLERFHRFKRSLRTGVRNVARAQFTTDSRQGIATYLRERAAPPKTTNGAAVTTYAEVPLLNAQQVVATWRQPVNRGERWDTQTVPVEARESGLYLVEAVSGKGEDALRAYTVMVVSPLAMITKSSPGGLTGFVVNRETGEPVPDCPVTLIERGERKAQLTTDAQGLVQTKVDAGESSEFVLLAHRTGREVAVAGLSGYSFGSQADSHRGYLYTDRPVYRPGHTVQYKGIVRRNGLRGYEMPTGREVAVEIRDPEGNAVHRTRLPLTNVSTASGSFALPASAPLGYYAIDYNVDGASMSGGFQVEEYKKPEYEVRVSPAQPRLRQGEPIKATIEARYFYGEPVPNAKVTYVVHRSRYWPPYYEMEDVEEGEDEGYGGEQIVEESGTLNNEGKLEVEIPTEPSEQHIDYRYRVEARVTDAGNREIAGAAGVIGTYGSFLLRVDTDQYVYQPGRAPRLAIEAQDYDRQGVATRVKVRIARWTWKDRQEGEVLFSGETQTDAQGTARLDTKPLPAGVFKVFVSADSNGREVREDTYLWVEGGGSSWMSSRGEEIQIVPDKKSYKPGETARVLLVTGARKSKVLVSVEGRGLESARVVAVNGPTTTIQVPIRADHAPNFYVSAAFIQGNTLRQGTKRIKVPTDKGLQVEVTTDKPQYKPGEPAVFTLTAKDATGKPASGEFSLGVVDEAIYAVRRESAPDILNFFHGRVDNTVGTDSSLSYYFHGEAGKRKMILTSLARPRAYGELKPASLVQPKVRKAFPDTALWVATLNTGPSGTATARVEFPDSLTMWRATARGVTMDTKVGSAVQRTIVRKELVLSLAVPRFFTHGDEVTLSALVRNYLPDAKTVRVSLDLTGADVLSGQTQDVSVPSKGDAKVDWRVRVRDVREVKVLGKALTDEESDAMELVLPATPRGTPQSIARSGTLGTGNEASATLEFPADAVASSRSLEVSMSPSLAGPVFGALDYLVDFPYGCTEQTMSRFLPTVLVTRAVKQLGVSVGQKEAKMPQMIRAGLERLHEHQHEDGGWGWWTNDESHPFMTAYVIAGLAQAKAAGVAVEEHRIERGIQWLRPALDKGKVASLEITPDLRAYAAYAFAAAGKSDKGLLDAVHGQRGQLTTYGLALLGLALSEAKDGRVSDVVASLEQKVKVSDADAFWPADRDNLMGFAEDTSPEATAYALKLLVKQRPQSPLLEKAAVWLMAHRNQGNYWNSSKQTAMVVYGLTDYLRLTGELKGNVQATVLVNGKPVLTKSFTAADALLPNAPSFTVPADQLQPGANDVRVQRTGAGRVYWSARGAYFSSSDKLTSTGSASLSISRDYFKLVPERTGDKIVHALQPVNGPVQVGDVVAVRLTVQGGSWSYLLVEDPIPAGTEHIEKDNLYELKEKPSWWHTYYDRRELRDDRTAIFQTYTNGDRQYVALLKVVNPGKFRANPARVQPMYQPRFLATTETKLFEVGRGE